MGFSVLAAREMKQEPKNERGRSGRFSKSRGLSASVSFLSSPPPPRSFTYAIFRAVFDSRSSFFAPKPHGNACYAGYLSRVRAYIELQHNLQENIVTQVALSSFIIIIASNS